MRSVGDKNLPWERETPSSLRRQENVRLLDEPRERLLEHQAHRERPQEYEVAHPWPVRQVLQAVVSDVEYPVHQPHHHARLAQVYERPSYAVRSVYEHRIERIDDKRRYYNVRHQSRHTQRYGLRVGAQAHAHYHHHAGEQEGP